MPNGLEPTEEYDGAITVELATDSGERDQIRCESCAEAISVVKDHQGDVTASAIASREGEVVFESADTDIDDWETEWQRAKRRQSVDVEEYECPYESVACVADDLCVKCKMDKVQNQY
jgi:hypothetical protein